MRGESLTGIRPSVITRGRWRAWFAQARARHRLSRLERLELIERLDRERRNTRRYGSRRH